MPAVVNNTVGSFSGIREAEGNTLCFLFLKNSIYFPLYSFASINTPYIILLERL